MIELFQQSKFAVSVLISLLFLQLIYGFLFPSVGFNDNWQPISAYLPKFSVENSDNFILGKIYPLISSQYRLNSDIGHYLELGRNFSKEYFRTSPFMERPLYPFLIFLFSLPFRFFMTPGYGFIFGLAILLNFILASASVSLFFLFLRKLFSLKVAWLSAILLIFSPFMHSFLSQPLAEMLMIFGVVLSAWLVYSYFKRPSLPRLIIFSLIVGVLMLGKMFFATSFFILFLALYHKRYKEGAIFFLVHLIPFASWFLWITKIWGLQYYSHGVQHYSMGTWMFEMIRWSWHKSYSVLLNVVPNFVKALIYGFLLVPVAFSLIGFSQIPFKAKNAVYFGSIFSVFLLGFLIGFYYIRHVFLLFPIIYPTAVLGMEKTAGFLAQRKSWYAPLFYAIVIILIVLVSNINIYRIFDYNG